VRALLLHKTLRPLLFSEHLEDIEIRPNNNFKKLPRRYIFIYPFDVVSKIQNSGHETL
jgi:hypothetical protein